jgi:hypothetical protein
MDLVDSFIKGENYAKKEARVWLFRAYCGYRVYNLEGRYFVLFLGTGLIAWKFSPISE